MPPLAGVYSDVMQNTASTSAGVFQGISQLFNACFSVNSVTR